jgi:hypothetical protein
LKLLLSNVPRGMESKEQSALKYLVGTAMITTSVVSLIQNSQVSLKIIATFSHAFNWIKTIVSPKNTTGVNVTFHVKIIVRKNWYEKIKKH